MRLVMLGDNCCGKTSVFMAFSKYPFRNDRIPVVFDNYVATVEVDEKQVGFYLFKTILMCIFQVGLTLLDQDRSKDGPDINRLTTQSFDIILLCYSIGSPDSLKCVVEKWAPMV